MEKILHRLEGATECCHLPCNIKMRGRGGEQQEGREQPFEFEFEGGKVCSADFIRQFKEIRVLNLRLLWI